MSDTQVPVPEPTEEMQQCEHCLREVPLSDCSMMEDIWICSKCYAEWKAEFDACEHDWKPYTTCMSEPGRICNKCNGVVTDEAALASAPAATGTISAHDTNALSSSRNRLGSESTALPSERNEGVTAMNPAFYVRPLELIPDPQRPGEIVWNDCSREEATHLGINTDHDVADCLIYAAPVSEAEYIVEAVERLNMYATLKEV